MTTLGAERPDEAPGPGQRGGLSGTEDAAGTALTTVPFWRRDEIAVALEIARRASTTLTLPGQPWAASVWDTLLQHVREVDWTYTDALRADARWDGRAVGLFGGDVLVMAGPEGRWVVADVRCGGCTRVLTPGEARGGRTRCPTCVAPEESVAERSGAPSTNGRLGAR